MFLPLLAVAASWYALYFAFFLPGIALLPLVAVVCGIWAWRISKSVAAWRYYQRTLACLRHERAKPLPQYERRLAQTFFILQLLGIFLTWPAFGFGLHVLSAMGYRVGWS